MITDTEIKWIRQALAAEIPRKDMAKTYRVISQIFQMASQRIEAETDDKMVDTLDH